MYYFELYEAYKTAKYLFLCIITTQYPLLLIKNMI